MGMNDTNRKQLGLAAHVNMRILLNCVDDPKGMKLSKMLHAKAIRDLAKWDAKAVECGWANAREWFAAGPHKPTQEEVEARVRALPPEIQAARAEMARQFSAALKGAGLTLADVSMPAGR